MQLNGDEGPTLATHSKTYFREIVRSFARYQGALWFGTYGRGLYRLAGGRLENFTSASSPLLENRVNCLAVKGGELWIGTCGGINVMDGAGKWRAITEADGVADRVYHTIELDRRGHVWVGTTGKGLSEFDGKAWRTYTASKDGLGGDWVNDVQETPDGCLWAATISGVSRRCGDGRWKVQMADKFPLYANASALALQGKALWVGFATDGLFMLEDGIWFRPPPSLLPAPTVRTMAVDATNVLWVGTEGGLASYDVKRDWDVESTNSGLVDRNIRTLFFDRETDTLYAGSVGGFVYGRSAGAKSWRVMVRQGQLEPGSTTGGKETHK